MIIPLPAFAAYRRDLESLSGATVVGEEIERTLSGWASFGAILESFLTELSPLAQKDGAVAVEHLVSTYASRLVAVADDRSRAADATKSRASAAPLIDVAGLAT